MSDPTEDFAAMFEASIKAKRLERGQSLEGRIVAIGPEVAFVDVGGKGEATIDIDELKDADGVKGAHGATRAATSPKSRSSMCSATGAAFFSSKRIRTLGTPAGKNACSPTQRSTRGEPSAGTS